MPDDLVDLIARRFRVIGEPMRIRLLDRLRHGEATVNELRDGVSASQQNVSKHLALLLEAGIVARRREGTHVLYSIADESVFSLCDEVCGGVQRQLAELNALVGETS
jgi:DNA-binding transcriptional ArsR family regulator